MASTARVFNSYDTDTFQRCPTEWDLKKRWQAKREVVQQATLIGSAVALGLETFYKGHGDGLAAAQQYVDTKYVEGGKLSKRGISNMVARGVQLGSATKMDIDKVEAVEQFFGRTKPDLVVRNRAGDLVVIDHKVKLTLDDRYLEKELMGYDTSNQLFLYSHMVGAEYGEHVGEAIIHMVILGPEPRTLLHPVKITEEHLRHWRTGIAPVWASMAAVLAGSAPAKHYSQCMGKFGKCDMYELCHILHGDESKADTLYEPYKPNW